MTTFRVSILRRSLLGTVFCGALLGANPAYADGAATERPLVVERSPSIIVNDTLNPNTPPPGGVLDTPGLTDTGTPGITIGLATGVTGIGQMTIRPNPATTGMSLCSGTLINPRTVILAAHCVNSRPADAYGVNGIANGLNPNGTPIAFGFGADNLPAVRQWLGLASVAGGTDANPLLRGATNEARALYAVEQVWYDPRSLALGPGLNFLQADVALATLDTPAFAIPTWTLLFSPLTAQTHAAAVGYGVSGTNATAQGAGCPAPFNACDTLGGIDFRRRAVENMLSVLGSLDDVDDAIFGPAPPSLVQSLYMEDFDSPAGEAAYNPTAGRYDFDIFNGAALPREGTTAGGDSGGPLVVDQAFAKSVVAGVLSGGSRFFNPQRFSTYGTHNFYQPLFLYWDVIVANNSYVYAGNKAGDGAWEDGAHWTQLMDPNYAVTRGGALINDLPDTPALGISGSTVKFGEVCFLSVVCENLANDATATPVPVGSGTGLVIAGGPGSTGFVPDNVTANPKTGIKARYYDVTLSAAGTTTLGSSRTVDKLTVNGATKLDIRQAGSLRVLGDFEQWTGWTNVDGLLRANDIFVANGFLTGAGTLRAPFVTVGQAIVAPAGVNRIGTLTIDGDAILSSQSALFIDAQRGKADKLAVTGDLAINQGASVVFSKPDDAPAPRFGEKYTIASASTIDGTFSTVYSFQGVLRPTLVYNPTSIVAELRAGSLVEILDGGSATEIAFAKALDALRLTSYNNLYGLYGAIDLMDGATLGRTLANLAPTGIAGESLALQDTQSRVMLGTIANRLSSLGSGGLGGQLSVIGAPGAAIGFSDGRTTDVMAGSGIAQLGGEQAIRGLPEGMSGFVSGGFTSVGTTAGARAGLSGQHSRHFAMGLEIPASDNLTIGTAFGQASGYAVPGAGSERAESRMSQVAIYGSYQLGGGAYLAGLASAERSRAGIDRTVYDGDGVTALTGATHAQRYSAMAEAGVNLALGNGLTVTPRVSLSYALNNLDGFRENGGEVALQLSDVSLQRLEAKLGAKLSGSTAVGDGWSFAPQIGADMVQNVGGNNAGMRVRFAAAPEYRFLLPLAGGDQRWAEVSGAMKLTKGRVEFGAAVQSSIGRSDFRDDRALASFAVRF